MEFAELLKIVGDEPVFETSLLFAGQPDLPYLQRQLSRWVRTGYLHQLRRGLYTLAPPYQKVRPHPFLIANRMVRASYVSGEAALALYRLIPEYVPTTTSVTTQRPGHWTTSYGAFHFQHIKSALFFGYESVQLDHRQQAFIATPEKALLDLIHLRVGADSADYLAGLRLQNLALLDFHRLDHFIERAGSAKLARVAKHIQLLAQTEGEEYQVLR